MDETISLEDGWKTTHDSIKRVIKIIEGGMKESFPIAESSQAYTVVYKMCTQKTGNHTEEMYKRYQESFQDYLVQNVLPAVRALEGEPMLKELVQRWINQKQMMKYLSNIFFKYLDRYHVPRHNLDTTRTVALKCFKKEVFDPVKERVRAAVLELAHQEREGDSIDHLLVKNVVQIFADLGLNENREQAAEDQQQSEITLQCYQTDFEEKFIEETHQYYARKAALWTEEDSFPDYMTKAEDYLSREKQRVKDYLHESTENKLLEACEHELLEVHQLKLLEKDTGVVALLSNQSEDDMARMFRLFSQKSLKNGLQPIGDIMKKYVNEQGDKVVDTSNDEEAEHMIERLLEQYRLFSAIVKNCFSSHAVFQRALKEAFEAVVNRDVQYKGKAKTSAELMADFCDRTLKNQQKLGDEEVVAVQDSAVQLFNHLQEDYFADFYRVQLGKRLLMFSHLREDWENDMILKLKLQCGSQFTAKMAGMVQDLATSKDFQAQFEEAHNEGKIVVNEADGGKAQTVEVKVQVLTCGFWPSYASPEELCLPPELVKCMDIFTTFYTSKQTHRKLKWVHTMGKNTLDMHGVTFGSKSSKSSKEKESKKKDKASKISIVLSTLQTLVLLLFNEQVPGQPVKLTTAEMANSIKVEVKDLKKYLKSLALGKEKILLKSGEAKDIGPEDVFEVNTEYTTAKNRVSIPLLVMQTDDKQVQDVHDNVQQDRKLAIEACIVRVMKARNHLTHQQLVMEVSQNLSNIFKPDARIIKKRIEDLIQRDYLERDETGSGYDYKA
jgi:cullin 1